MINPPFRLILIVATIVLAGCSDSNAPTKQNTTSQSDQESSSENVPSENSESSADESNIIENNTGASDNADIVSSDNSTSEGESGDVSVQNNDDSITSQIDQESSSENSESGNSESNIIENNTGASDNADNVSSDNSNSEGESGDVNVQINDVSVQSNDDSKAPLLNSDNANAVIRQAFEIFSGRAYDQRLTTYPYTEESLIDYIYWYIPRGCQNNGAAIQIRTETPSSDSVSSDTYYSDCQIGEDVLNGRYALHRDSKYRGGFKREFSDNFSLSFQSGGVMDLAGTYFYQPSLYSNRIVGVSALDYHFSYEGGTLTIKGANTRRAYSGFEPADDNSRFAHMTGSFNMQAPILNGAPVDVSITEDFSNTQISTQLSYESGRMKIVADGSSIDLDSNTGDQDTVFVTLTTSTGSKTTVTENWSTWASALAFSPARLDDTQMRPLPDGEGSAINVLNYKDVLADVFEVYSGKQFRSDILALPDYPEPGRPSEFMIPGFEGLGEPVVQQCTNGGTASLAPYRYGWREVTEGWEYDFANCEYNTKQYSGHFYALRSSFLSATSTGLTITTANSTTEFSGSLSHKPGPSRDGGPTRLYSLGAVNYNSNASGRIKALSAAHIYYKFVGPYSAELTGSFYMKSNITNGFTFGVTITSPLIANSTVIPAIYPYGQTNVLENFTSGVIIVDAGNNNILKVNTANDDQLTFEVTLYRPDQEPIEVTENWEDWESLLSFYR